MIIAISGSREGWTERQALAVRNLFRIWGATQLVHGDCRGVDAQADELAQRMGILRFCYPSTFVSTRAHCERWGCQVLARPAHPMERNTSIVGLGEALVAVPRGSSRGTWDAVRRARQIRRPVVVLNENGEAWYPVRGR